MGHALGLLAFFSLITAQALAAVFACLYPWHRLHPRARQQAQSGAPAPTVCVWPLDGNRAPVRPGLMPLSREMSRGGSDGARAPQV
jgi:hypothetical protein